MNVYEFVLGIILITGIFSVIRGRMGIQRRRIKEIIEVPFTYPRDETIQEKPGFGELRSRIRELVMTPPNRRALTMRSLEKPTKMRLI